MFNLVKYTKAKAAKDCFDDVCRGHLPYMQLGGVSMKVRFDKSDISFRTSPPKLVAYYTGTIQMNGGKLARTMRYRYERGKFIFEHAFPVRVER